MKTLSVILVAAAAVLAGCGDDDDDAGASQDAPAGTPAAPATAKKAPARKGTRIVLRDSEYGSILFGPKRQAIYIFQNDSKGKSACYGECAAAWPPVFTKGKPRAGKGVRQSLLGTTRRRNGRRQVTYAGKPLYYYAHEGPDEVRCHNVDLNGGFWWAIGPNGKRRP